jgi:glucose/arabinose dehydrogenase
MRHESRAFTMRTITVAALLVLVAGCREKATLDLSEGTGPSPSLPDPNPTLTTLNYARAVGWPAGGQPIAAPGISVAAFAAGLDHPRWLYVLPNGDVLVAESNTPPWRIRGPRDLVKAWVMKCAAMSGPSANRITLLRDTDNDGVADTRTVFLSNLFSPFGMALVGTDFYVANADSLMRFPYSEGETSIASEGVKVTDLPAGLNHHWTKNVIASRDGARLYVTVGSNSDHGENGDLADVEKNRAAIWEIDRATNVKRLFATGLRNPNGMDWEPGSGELWVAVNERDEIGSDLVPDYITSVQDGGFYGWPYSYFGKHVDKRVKPQDPDLVAKALVPKYALGPHTASLGIAFAKGASLPAQFREGMFVAQHGSWNRNPKSGYKVIFVPFSQGNPSGPPLDVLTGFLNKKEQAQGRPVGVIQDAQGALLVSDDVGNVIWRVTAAAL